MDVIESPARHAAVHVCETTVVLYAEGVRAARGGGRPPQRRGDVVIGGDGEHGFTGVIAQAQLVPGPPPDGWLRAGVVGTNGPEQ
eukprot:gene24806-35818_t